MQYNSFFFIHAELRSFATLLNEVTLLLFSCILSGMKNEEKLMLSILFLLREDGIAVLNRVQSSAQPVNFSFYYLQFLL